MTNKIEDISNKKKPFTYFAYINRIMWFKTGLDLESTCLKE